MTCFKAGETELKEGKINRKSFFKNYSLNDQKIFIKCRSVLNIAYLRLKPTWCKKPPAVDQSDSRF